MHMTWCENTIWEPGTTWSCQLQTEKKVTCRGMGGLNRNAAVQSQCPYMMHVTPPGGYFYAHNMVRKYSLGTRHNVVMPTPNRKKRGTVL